MNNSLVFRPLSRPCISRASTRSRAVIFSRLNSTSQATETTLSWPEYLSIRRQKRKWEKAVTIPCAILGFVGGITYFGSLETDPTKPIFGVDPLFFYGFCTVGSVGAGALIGPTIGGFFWRITHRQTMSLIEAREREFYRRIQKNRADPTAQSATNPVPDFYGEKIGSLHDYRQWLRDQAKYKKKSQLPEK